MTRARGPRDPPADEERVRLAQALLDLGRPDRAEELVAPVREFENGAAVTAWLITALAATTSGKTTEPTTLS